MNKKGLACIIAILLILITSTAFSSAYVSGAGSTSVSPVVIDLNNPIYGNGILTLEDGGYFTIVDSTSIARDLIIECTNGNTHLTVSSININPQSADQCALSFTGTGNELLIDGVNTFTSNTSQPGIRVEAGTELTIQNASSTDGELNAISAKDGAGIGRGNRKDSGTIIINSGIIHAISNTNGAGIGGGSHGSGGTTVINGGTISATSTYNGTGIGCGDYMSGNAITGGYIKITGGVVTATSKRSFAAGIGGSYKSAGGTIIIEGGIVTAQGASVNGAGIGNGAFASLAKGTITANSTVTITGGTVYATGGSSAAGIGGGYGGDGCDVIISNGAIVYVQGDTGSNTEHDIGRGRLQYATQSLVDNTLTISGTNTLVFTRYNTVHPSPILNDGIGYHTDTAFITSIRNSKGLTTTPWTSALGLYTVSKTLSFATNTTATVSNIPKPQLLYPGQYATAPTINPSRAGYTFGGWYQDAECTNPWLFSSMAVNSNTTLYAKWTGDAKILTYDSNGGTGSRVDTHQVGTCITLSDGSTFSNSGHILVGWTIDGVDYMLNSSYTMPIENKTAYAIWTVVAIPQTGDTTLIFLWISIAFGILLVGGLFIICRHKNSST